MSDTVTIDRKELLKIILELKDISKGIEQLKKSAHINQSILTGETRQKALKMFGQIENALEELERLKKENAQAQLDIAQMRARLREIEQRK